MVRPELSRLTWPEGWVVSAEASSATTKHGCRRYRYSTLGWASSVENYFSTLEPDFLPWTYQSPYQTHADTFSFEGFTEGGNGLHCVSHLGYRSKTEKWYY